MTSQTQIPQLKTDRLLLRAFKLSDAKEVQRMAGSKKVFDTTATIPHPYPDGAAEEWIAKHAEWFEKNLSANWAITLDVNENLIGCMSLMISQAHQRAEIAYWLGEEFWGKGYCTEAAAAAIDYGFKERNLNKVTSHHMAENAASGKVMIKNGMKQEGILRQHFFKNDRLHDMVFYGILKSEWKRPQL